MRRRQRSSVRRRKSVAWRCFVPSRSRKTVSGGRRSVCERRRSESS
jgi:hypothetical protein